MIIKLFVSLKKMQTFKKESKTTERKDYEKLLEEGEEDSKKRLIVINYIFVPQKGIAECYCKNSNADFLLTRTFFFFGLIAVVLLSS